jgi:putative ABC transport system permease protein
MRRVLIVAEISIALVLVCTASTFAAACAAFTSRPVGWTTSGLFHGIFILPWDPYSKEGDRGRRFVEEIERDFAAIPGVERAALASLSPLWGSWGQQTFVEEGVPPPEAGRAPMAAGLAVTNDFFATLEIPLIRGRTFSSSDRFDSPRVAVINRALADTLWPGADPLGKRIRYTLGTESFEIVGVVGDIEFGGEAGRPETRLQIYQPAAQTLALVECVLLRTAGDPARYTDTVRRIIAAKDADVTLAWAGTAHSQMRNSNRYFDTIAGNLVVFAVVALFIAVIGIYGVIANLTAMSVRAIAVRMALGALYSDIMRLILGHGMRLVLAGLLVGTALTYGLMRLLGHYVSGLHQPGAWVIAAGMAALAAAGLLACWLPAHRAARVDPLIALRGE